VVAEQTAGGYRGKLPPGPPVEPKPAKTDHAVLAVTLEENKLKWRANGSKNYRFNFQRSCFCLRDDTREAVVEVARRSSRRPMLTTVRPVDADLNDRYDTVDELFALLEEAVVSGGVLKAAPMPITLRYPRPRCRGGWYRPWSRRASGRPGGRRGCSWYWGRRSSAARRSGARVRA